MSQSQGAAGSPSHHGRLTSMDASFLYFERESAPMHIGALGVIDGELDYEAYLAQVENRLRKLPRFRERIVPPPLYVGHPTWETDPDFDLKRHVPLHQLPAPGGVEELRQLTNRLIAGQLDRTRPLWEIHIIEGLEGGRSALVSKVHHAMVDGVGGNAIMLALFDLEPDPPEKEFEERYLASQPPTPLRRVGEAMWDNVRTQIDVWSSHLNRLTDIGQATGVGALRRTMSTMSETMPDLLLPPRKLPFNRPCNGERDFTWTELSFASAREIRRTIGGTLNDVILTGLAGALATYARHHGEDTAGRTARVMVPVNVRPEGDNANLGNLVSILPVRLPLDIDDPEKRLQSVRAGTRTLKEARIAEGVSLMTNLASAVPAPLQAVFGAIAISPYPLFNLVCTNVPGPQIPLYAQGHRLESYYPIVPVGFDMGVCCAIFSYAQRLYFGLNSDVGACGDVDVLREYLDESFAEMEELAGGSAGLGEVAVGPVPIRGRGDQSPGGGRGRTSSRKGSGAKKKTTARKKVRKKAKARKKPARKKAGAPSSRRESPSKMSRAKKSRAGKSRTKKGRAKKKG